MIHVRAIRIPLAEPRIILLSVMKFQYLRSLRTQSHRIKEVIQLMKRRMAIPRNQVKGLRMAIRQRMTVILSLKLRTATKLIQSQ